MLPMNGKRAHHPPDLKAGIRPASFSPTDRQPGAAAKSRTFQFPRVDVPARREGALTDRLNTSRVC